MSGSRPTKITVSEIFGPTIQGEGPLAGYPTVFLRTGGCDYVCQWCDTLYAVLPEHARSWTKMTPDHAFDQVAELANHEPILVTLSGGNPALQKGLAWLIHRCRVSLYPVACETQGSHAPAWLSDLDWLILSPKGPSSGMRTDWAKLHECSQIGPPRTFLKIVVGNLDDLTFALEVRQRLNGMVLPPLYLQSLNPDGANNQADPARMMERYRWLTETVLAMDLRDVVVLPQIHALTWGAERGR